MNHVKHDKRPNPPGRRAARDAGKGRLMWLSKNYWRNPQTDVVETSPGATYTREGGGQ